MDLRDCFLWQESMGRKKRIEIQKATCFGKSFFSGKTFKDFRTVLKTLEDF